MIINAVVDSNKGVVGVLTERELISAVDEFISLNERRQQSYFHAGFRDALFDRPFDADMQTETERRARWYWAGAIVGLARSKSWDRMVEAYESTDHRACPWRRSRSGIVDGWRANGRGALEDRPHVGPA